MRKKRNYKRYHRPDIEHGRVDITRFTNYVMRDGKKAVAEAVVRDAFARVHELTKEEPIAVFEKALTNAAPVLEVASRRVGGANYQIPQEVKPERGFILACRWIIGAARARKGRPISEKIADELIAAAKNEGAAIKKKQDTHRMAESNRAFAHFARSRSGSGSR